VELAKRLSPVPPTGSKRLAQLIADLDSARFPVRRAAAAELALLGELAETAMRKAREGPTSAEMRLRLDELLARTEQWTEDDVRARRALRVLERLGNVEARRFLERLGAGAS